MRLLSEYSAANVAISITISDSPVNCWTPPTSSRLKLNIDAAMVGDGRWRLGASFRDGEGNLVMMATQCYCGAFYAEVAEALS